jgi:hypothetical protein
MVRRTLCGKVMMSDPKGRLNRTAEEYYKNDYPDEESSDYDVSEGSDGASPSVLCPSFFLWKQLCVPIDVIYDDSGG